MTTLALSETTNTLILDDENPITISVVQETIALLAVAEQGPPGPAQTDDQVNFLIEAAIAARFPGMLDFSIIDSAALAVALGAI